MFEKEFREWFESNKKWLFSSDHLQAAYFAWCAGIQQQQAAEQNMHLTGGIHPLVEFLSDPDKFSASEQNPIPPTRK